MILFLRADKSAKNVPKEEIRQPLPENQHLRAINQLNYTLRLK
ncbi:hypothetical protein D1BOALGB6SA_6417 [Olavius sp. associated proteobacterium Delta 1]|nr:hypothetical protein D1BOALGB6SA_6417 [Olavius sp. associated proteobacterium Delta 1]